MDVAILLFLIGIVVTLVVGSVFFLNSKEKVCRIFAWIFIIVAIGITIYILVNSLSCAPQTVKAVEATEVLTDLGTPEPTPERGIIKETRPHQGIIAAGNDFTVALLSDGTVKCIGNDKEIHVEGWDSITQLSAHGKHVLGLRQDQTVVFSGISNDGEKNVSAWTNIVEVATSNKGSFGLTTKGRVRFTGYDINDLSACESWTGVKRIYDGEDHFIALGNSGMLVGSGSHGGGDGRRKISELTDVVTACAANGSTFAVFSNGTVQALGTDYAGEDKVGQWRDIVAVAGGERHTVGLKKDGRVVAVGMNDEGQCNVTDWTDIVAICCGPYHTVGVKSDGTLVATGRRNSGQCDVAGIDLW